MLKNDIVKKEKAVIIFTDIDKMSFPINMESINKLINLVKEMQEKNNVQVKICPISTRASGFVLGQMHMIRNIFKEVGLDKVFVNGVAEHGAYILDGDRSFNIKYAGDGAYMTLKKDMQKFLEDSPFKDKIATDPDKQYTSSIYIKNYRTSHDVSKKIFSTLQTEIKNTFGQKVDIFLSHKCLEIKPTGVEKSRAINQLLEKFDKEFDLVQVILSKNLEKDKHIKVPPINVPKDFELWKKKIGSLLVKHPKEIEDPNNQDKEDSGSKYLPKKERSFILFTDLDKTFSPIGLKDIKDFAQLVKEIKERENVEVKFCPVSGRPGAYIRGQMDVLRSIFNSEGLKNVFDYGIAEQGSIITMGKQPFHEQYIGDPANINLKEDIKKILTKDAYKDIVIDEVDKRFTCSLHVIDKPGFPITPEDKKKVYNQLEQDIKALLGESVDVAKAHDCMEVMSKEVSKGNAINWVINRNMKSYEVSGISFSGDAGNDKMAVKYVSKLAEIPGMKANVYLPSNAIEEIQSKALESWKEKIPSSTNRILISDEIYFKGVMKLIRNALNNGTLLRKGNEITGTKDDINIGKNSKIKEAVKEM